MSVELVVVPGAAVEIALPDRGPGQKGLGIHHVRTQIPALQFVHEVLIIVIVPTK